MPQIKTLISPMISAFSSKNPTINDLKIWNLKNQNRGSIPISTKNPNFAIISSSILSINSIQLYYRDYNIML